MYQPFIYPLSNDNSNNVNVNSNNVNVNSKNMLHIKAKKSEYRPISNLVIHNRQGMNKFKPYNEYRGLIEECIQLLHILKKKRIDPKSSSKELENIEKLVLNKFSLIQSLNKGQINHNGGKKCTLRKYRKRTLKY